GSHAAECGKDAHRRHSRTRDDRVDTSSRLRRNRMIGPGQNQGAFLQTNLLKSTLQHDVEPLALRRLDRAIGRATRAVLACQRADGHWIFELEADATIPSEYVLLQHFLGTPPSA